MNFIVREAMHSEIPAIVRLAKDFFDESNFSRSGLTADLDAYRRTIENYWRYPSVKSFVALDSDNGDLLGYVHVYMQQDYTVEKVGEMYQFYVVPRARKTPVTRELVAAACHQFDEWGCARSYCECAPGLPDEKSIKTFSNLWRKFGYVEVGVTLMREANYGRQISGSNRSTGPGSTPGGSGSGPDSGASEQQRADASDGATGADNSTTGKPKPH